MSVKGNRWMVWVLSAVLLAAGWGTLSADESSSTLVLERLKRIEQNQERILEKLAEIRSELDIVKVRASLRG